MLPMTGMTACSSARNRSRFAACVNRT
jgi:hypothetical protein